MSDIFQEKVSSLVGVGEKRKDALKKLNITTIWDLLTFFPFRYEDLTVKEIDKIEDRQKVVLQGVVIAPPYVNYYGHRKSMLSFRINVDRVIVPVTFFNQPYLAKQIEEGKTLKVFGTWDARRMQLSGIKLLGEANDTDDFEPVYHSNKNITHGTIKKFVQQAWEKYHMSLKEILPTSLRESYQLLPIKKAIYNMHFPENPSTMNVARETIIFTEFFLFQYQIQYRRMKHKKVNAGKSIPYDVNELKDFFAQLPFELTDAQKSSVNTISADMKRNSQMYRLLQGDVGSGKTIVAAGGIVAAQSGGVQSAFMAPTEILAEQHYNSLKKVYEHSNIQISLLTGSTTASERKKILEKLSMNKIDLLIGTHALIQDDVVFHNLGFIVIDEQHRFGVEQRRVLREKGDHPDVLFMTATPIPRTLSITAYGEMDVTVLDEMPPGRLPVQTHWIRKKQLEQLMKTIDKELKKQSQAYVISPLIEESDAMDLENAIKLAEIYDTYFSPEYTVALLHGRMSSSEKEEIMERFKNHEIDILVSTTVIEVGVDVSNATMMVIHDADRFGLAQLHQLRGRVGRSNKQSYCILVADPKSENGIKRMQIMTETTDGFKISQKDLEMRGPGEFFGKKQSGVPEFKVGDLIEDERTMEIARIEAANLLNNKENIDPEELKNLRKIIGIEDGKINDILD